VQTALQKAPEVLHRVRVDVPVHVLNRMIDDSVLIVRFQPIVGLQLIAKDGRASFYTLADQRLKVFLLASLDMTGNYLSRQ
jgi:hypothetical protein